MGQNFLGTVRRTALLCEIRGLDLNKVPQGIDIGLVARGQLLRMSVWTLKLVPRGAGLLSACVQSVVSQVTSRWCSDNREKRLLSL